MRVADVLARALATAGVRHVFGIPGGEVVATLDALGRCGLEFVTARHETAAGLMAEGSALASGAPGVLLVTLGPGLTNAINAVANAHLDRVPLLVISAAPEDGPLGAFSHQRIDQQALLRPLVKASLRVNARDVHAQIAHALELAVAYPRGPVHLDLPAGVASATARSNTSATPPAQGEAVARGEFEPAARLGPVVRRAPLDVEALRTAADWLACAQRPLVLAGLEASDARTAAGLASLLDSWPAPLLTTYKAKGVLQEDDPRCIGAIALSPRADALVAPLLAEADAVLLVGYDPVEMRAAYVQPFGLAARVIELAPGMRHHGMHRADVTLQAELASGLHALSAELEKARASRAAPLWPGGRPAAVRQALRAAFAPTAGTTLTPLDVAAVIAEELPDTVALTIDTGAHRIALSQVACARRVGQVLQSNGLCTMGYALPSAIGWSMASGARPVIAAMGDGGLEMVLGELATLRDLQLPVTLVVFDDRALALIEMKQRAAGFAASGVWLGASDHVAIAQAYGGRGVRVADRDALRRALRTGLAQARGFTLISCDLPRGAYDAVI